MRVIINPYENNKLLIISKAQSISVRSHRAGNASLRRIAGVTSLSPSHIDLTTELKRYTTLVCLFFGLSSGIFT